MSIRINTVAKSPQPAALWSGVPLHMFIALTSAPLLINAATDSASPQKAAWCRGVEPMLFLASTTAPFSNSMTTASLLQLPAECRGVLNALSHRFTLAPTVMSSWRLRVLDMSNAAKCTGALPEWPPAFTSVTASNQFPHHCHVIRPCPRDSEIQQRFSITVPHVGVRSVGD